MIYFYITIIVPTYVTPVAKTNGLISKVLIRKYLLLAYLHYSSLNSIVVTSSSLLHLFTFCPVGYH